MKHRMTRPRRAFAAHLAASAAVVLGAATLSDCTPRPLPPVTATLLVGSLRAHDAPEATRDGLTVTILPINGDNYTRFPQTHRRVTWTRTVVRGGQVLSEPGSADATIVPVPCFKVSIANHTGHVLRFTQSVFRMQDNLGRAYQLYSGTPELLAWNESVWGTALAAAPELNAQVLPQVRGAVGQLQLLNRNTELLNGDEWTGFLVFNLNLNSQSELEAFMSEIARVTVRLAEIPVEVNEAGAPTRTTEFSFAFDRAQVAVQVTCPPGTETPSLTQCAR